MSDPKGSPSDNDGTSGEENQESPRRSPISEELMHLVGASPPKFVTMEQVLNATDGFKNMTLVHEIAVNNDFKLPDERVDTSDLQKQVRETVHKAFWDAFKDKLEQDPPDYSMVYSMLSELKKSLLLILMPQHTSLKEQINQVLDLELIKQKIENEAFDFDYYGDYVTGIMAKLCAPIRDEKIEEIKAIKDVVPKFKCIMESLDLMRKDMANFSIKQVRPYIQQNSIEYERKTFAEFFDTQEAVGINALQHTEIWLKRNVDKLKAAAEKQKAAAASVSASNMPTPAEVMIEAYLDILEWTNPLSFPETLMIDQVRFMSMRDTLHSLAIITAVQLVTFSVVGAPIEGVEPLKVQLKQHVEVLLADVATAGINSVLQSIAAQAVKDVNDSLTARSMPKLSDEMSRTLNHHIYNLVNRENQVRGLMFQRMMNFIREGLSGKNLNSMQLPKGCTAVAKELSQVLGNFLRLTSHNRSVFGDRYAAMIEGLIKPNAPPPLSDNDANKENSQ